MTRYGRDMDRWLRRVGRLIGTALGAFAGVTATIVRTETNSDSSAPYESHITTADGKQLEVLVSKDFEVVDAREHPARR